MSEENTELPSLPRYRGHERKLYRWLRRSAWLELGAGLVMHALFLVCYLQGEGEPAGAMVLVMISAGALALVFGGARIASGVLYLRWLYVCIQHFNRIEPERYSRKPSELIWGYVIPIVNLVRPYEMVKALHAASDPSDLPARPPREEPAHDYRQMPRTRILDSERWRRPFPLLAWWILRLFDYLLDRVLASLPDPGDPRVTPFTIVIVALGGVVSVATVSLFLRMIAPLQAARQERLARQIALARAG